MTYEEAHLLSLVSTLGQRHAESGYVKDPDCEASLHDIIRFLQKDTSLERSVFLQLATWNVLGKDLLPLFSVHHAQPDICTLLVKLLVFLTLPPERESNNFIRQARATRTVIRLCLDNKDFLNIMLSTMANALQKLDAGALTERDSDAKLLQLALTFFRNVLVTAEICDEVASHDDSLLDELVKKLLLSNFTGVLALLIQDVEKSPIKNEVSLLAEILQLVLCTGTKDTTSKIPHSGEGISEIHSLRNFKTMQRVTRFNGVYVTRTEKSTFFETLSRGAPSIVNNRSRPPTISCTSAAQNDILFMKTVSHSAVNQFMLIAWDKIRRHKQDLGYSPEYLVQLRSFSKLAAFFISFFRLHDKCVQADGVEVSCLVANILCPEFITWLHNEWSSLAEQKLFDDCVPIIELLTEIARLLEHLRRHNIDTKVEVIRNVLRAAFLGKKTKHPFSIILCARLRHYKWSSMSKLYLNRMFTLLAAVIRLEKEEKEDATGNYKEFAAQLMISDRIILQNLLRFVASFSIHPVDPGTFAELLRHVVQHLSHGGFSLQALMQLQLILNGKVEPFATISKQIVCRVLPNAFKAEIELKGASFVALLR